MSELITNSVFWLMILIVSAAMVIVFYRDIKTYLVDKEMVAWKRSKGYLTEEQANAELQKAKRSLRMKIVIGSILYYAFIFAIILGIGLIFCVLLCGGILFGYYAPRWRPWPL